MKGKKERARDRGRASAAQIPSGGLGGASMRATSGPTGKGLRKGSGRDTNRSAGSRKRTGVFGRSRILVTKINPNRKQGGGTKARRRPC